MYVKFPDASSLWAAQTMAADSTGEKGRAVSETFKDKKTKQKPLESNC